MIKAKVYFLFIAGCNPSEKKAFILEIKAEELKYLEQAEALVRAQYEAVGWRLSDKLLLEIKKEE